MGHWILSQCDTYTPAASAACQAFQAAFSPSKQPEALGFCKDEILNVSFDGTLIKEETPCSNLPNFNFLSVSGSSGYFVERNGRLVERSTVRSAPPLPVCRCHLSETQPLLLSRNVTAEEKEAKYLRMLTSSLLGVRTLLSLLLPSDRAALEGRLASLLSSGKFWKYGKHKSPQVRLCYLNVHELILVLVLIKVHGSLLRFDSWIKINDSQIKPQFLLFNVW